MCHSRFFRVYAPDLPGEPGQSDDNQLPFDTDDYANWLVDTFAGLSIEKAAVVGASLGAWLTAKFSIHHPDKVTKLVLLCPAGIGSQNHAFKEKLVPQCRILNLPDRGHSLTGLAEDISVFLRG